MTTKLNSRLADVALKAVEQGFTVFIHKDDRRPAGFFYACKSMEGSFVTVQVPSHSWDDLDVTVPIKPSREYGSGVLIDHDGSTESILKAMGEVCDSATVLTRFVRNPKHVPNFGRGCVDSWPGGGLSQFEVWCKER